mgnify:CR=1 FL=1
MKRIALFILVGILVINSCGKRSSAPVEIVDELGSLNLALDLSKAPAEVVDITGYLTRVGFDTTFLNFTILDESASCFRENLVHGEWSLTVDALNSDGIVYYTGSTTLEIIPGQTQEVSLTLNPTTGSLEIDITWGFNIDGLRFSAGDVFAVGSDPLSVINADLDQDSDLDVVVANYQSHSITIFENDGDGNLSPIQTFMAGYHPADLLAENLDGQGPLEIVVVNYDINYEGVTFLNYDSSSEEYVVSQFITTAKGPKAIQSGDLDGDGDLDLALGVRNEGKFSTLINDGQGVFSLESTINTGGMVGSTACADFDGDLDIDVAITTTGTNQLLLYLNDGAANFTLDQTYALNDECWDVVTNDIDNDNDMDLIVCLIETDQVTLLFNNGNATFFEFASYATGAEPMSISVGDFNNDNDLDFAVANKASGDINFFCNSDNQSFYLAYTHTLASGLRDICAGDLDGDSYLDVLAVNKDTNQFSILINQVP